MCILVSYYSRTVLFMQICNICRIATAGAQQHAQLLLLQSVNIISFSCNIDIHENDIAVRWCNVYCGLLYKMCNSAICIAVGLLYTMWFDSLAGAIYMHCMYRSIMHWRYCQCNRYFGYCVGISTCVPLKIIHILKI